jgi:ligand-binding sensor domain-containing protein
VKLFRGFHPKNVVVDQFGREWLLTDRGVRSSNGKITSRVNADFSAESNGRTYFVSSTGQIISIGKNEKSFRREYLKTGSVHVNDLCANNGVLVLATDKGLVYYDVKRRTCSLQVLLHAMLPNHGVEKIYFDSRHRMWLFTDNDGIVMIDKGKLEWLQAEAVSPLERTRCDAFFLHEDEHRTVWTVPTGGTFSYYDEATHKLVPYVLRSKEAPFTALPLIKKYFIDNQHNLWFSGDRNLTQIDFRRHRQLYVPTMSNVEVRALCMDNNGNIWVGEHDGVLSVYDIKGHLKGYMSATGRLTNTRQAMSTRIYSLFEDSRKRLWIGTKGDGLYCYHDGRMNHYLHDNKDKWSLSLWRSSAYTVCMDAGRQRRRLELCRGGAQCIVQQAASRTSEAPRPLYQCRWSVAE